MKAELKTSELRIGNYVQDREGNTCMVETIGRTIEECNIYRLNSYITAMPISSIPLDEAWLLKMGFEGHDHFTIMNDKFLKLSRNRYISIGCVGTPNEMIFLQEIEEGKVNDLICLRNFDYDGRMHVHTLQNLIYSISGEELTVSE